MPSRGRGAGCASIVRTLRARLLGNGISASDGYLDHVRRIGSSAKLATDSCSPSAEIFVLFWRGGLRFWGHDPAIPRLVIALLRVLMVNAALLPAGLGDTDPAAFGPLLDCSNLPTPAHRNGLCGPLDGGVCAARAVAQGGTSILGKQRTSLLTMKISWPVSYPPGAPAWRR
jgi:hypothetical protein